MPSTATPRAPRLAHVVERLRAEGLEVGGSQALKSPPRRYPQDHPRI
jgi:hypothetical protein